MADADTAGMALIQATAPAVTAAAMSVGGCAVIAIAGYPVLAAIVTGCAAACGVLAATTARHAGRASQARAALRTELVIAVQAWPEMASLGAAGELATRTTRQLDAYGNRLHRRAATQARTAGAADAPALVFLALTATGVMANAERLIPAAEAGVLARQAARRLVDGDGEQQLTSSPGAAFSAVFDGSGLTVDAYAPPGRPARRIGFTVRAGQTLVVTGASGAGKTTLLNAVAAALRQAGTHPCTVTSVLADDYLFTGTVGSNIRLASPLSSDSDIEDLLAALLLDRGTSGTSGRIGLATPVGVGGRALSGGEQRRLYIARALAARPDVLLIDEPVTSLDVFTGNQVIAAARQRLPRAVLVLAMHELPADISVLGPDWTFVPLDQDQAKILSPPKD
jgi:ATP-binding cassette, subfamily C, bacterial CydC